MSGSVVQTLDYYPFGATRIETGEDVSKRKFIGIERDEETELDYALNRYYANQRGQFISQDPTFLAIGNRYELENLTGLTQEAILADPQQLNSYAYGRNNPIRFKDPKGLYAESGFDIAMLGASLYQFSQDPSWTNAGAVFLDAGSLALPGIPAVGGMAVRGGKYADDAASILARNREAGAFGERAAGITKNTEKIPSVSKPGTSRIPDVLDHANKTIGDVKNTNYQSFTGQLRDIYSHGKNISYQFQLTVDVRTRISNTLKQLGNQIEIIRKELNKLQK